MKKTIFSALVLGTLVFSACNSEAGDKSATQDEGTATTGTTEQTPAANDDKDLKVVNAKYTGVDAKVTGSVQELVTHYIHLKNALASDNTKEAGAAAKELKAAYAKIDQASLTAEQKAVLKDNGDDLKEMADHIDESTDKIDHQREHFGMLSEDVYALVTAFGAGQTLYQTHCPMYNENKGANWLSETKEVKNPYYGSKMPKCGKVEEVIR